MTSPIDNDDNNGSSRYSGFRSTNFRNGKFLSNIESSTLPRNSAASPGSPRRLSRHSRRSHATQQSQASEFSKSKIANLLSKHGMYPNSGLPIPREIICQRSKNGNGNGNSNDEDWAACLMEETKCTCFSRSTRSHESTTLSQTRFSETILGQSLAQRGIHAAYDFVVPYRASPHARNSECFRHLQYAKEEREHTHQKQQPSHLLRYHHQLQQQHE